MNWKISISIIFITLFFFANAQAQSMKKKVRTVKTTLVVDAPAEKVWTALVKDYGHIGNFSPYIYSSNYENGSLEGKNGAQRKCAFNKKGTQWVREELKNVNHQKMIATTVPIEGKKLPLNFDNSRAFYTVVDNGNGTSTVGYEFQFRTKPAFMGIFAKGGFKKQLSGTLVGLKHYMETGEKVTPQNKKYNEIKNNYPKPTVTD